MHNPYVWRKENHRKKFLIFFVCRKNYFYWFWLSYSQILLHTGTHRNNFYGAQKKWEFFSVIFFFKNADRTCTFIRDFRVVSRLNGGMNGGLNHYFGTLTSFLKVRGKTHLSSMNIEAEHFPPRKCFQRQICKVLNSFSSSKQQHNREEGMSGNFPSKQAKGR